MAGNMLQIAGIWVLPYSALVYSLFTLRKPRSSLILIGEGDIRIYSNVLYYRFSVLWHFTLSSLLQAFHCFQIIQQILILKNMISALRILPHWLSVKYEMYYVWNFTVKCWHLCVLIQCLQHSAYIYRAKHSDMERRGGGSCLEKDVKLDPVTHDRLV